MRATGKPAGAAPAKTYAARTPEDIQRNYDAVPPVVKPPSAPVVPPAAPETAPEPKAPNGSCGGCLWPCYLLKHLIITASNDLDDLTRRLDALKRGR